MPNPIDDNKSYVLLTDAFPLRSGGAGCQVLGRDLLDALGDQVRLIVTHRSIIGRTERASSEQGQPVKVVYYYNFRGFRLGRLPLLRRLLEWLCFLLVLPGLVRAVRRSKANRIFALSGYAPGFLFFASMLACATGLPFDLYLVDDYEEVTRQSRQAYLIPAVRYFERRYLRQAARVFAISPGYVEHLWAKYGQCAHWLPVLALNPVPPWQFYPLRSPDERSLVFVGSISFLYEDCLVDIYQAVLDWNESMAPFRLRLKIITRHRPETLLRRLPSTDSLDLILNADDATKNCHVQAAWANVLPYAFTPQEKVFVTTSFSYKFTDAINAGRPILVYGPPYASLPRYFREEELPLQASSKAELKSALAAIEQFDRPETQERYASLVERHHSPRAVRRVLAESGPTGQ